MTTEGEDGGGIADPVSVTEVDRERVEDAGVVDSSLLPQTVRRSTDPTATIPGPPPPPPPGGASHGALPRRGHMKSGPSKTLLGIEPVSDERAPLPLPPPPPEQRAAPVAPVPGAPGQPSSTEPGPAPLGPPRSFQPTLPVMQQQAGAPPSPSHSPGALAPATLGSPTAHDARALGLVDALGQRVRVGGGGVPLALLLAVGWLVSLAVVLVVARLLLSPPTASAPPAADPGETEAPAPSADPEPPVLSLLERAKRGEPAALEELGEKPPLERTVEESLALSGGTLAKEHAEIVELGARLEQNADLLRDRKIQTTIRQRAYDMDTYRETLGMLARLPGPEGADMLYLLWTATQGSNDATKLAEELVKTREVRKRASPSLAVALDLRLAETCEQVLGLLPVAIEHADQRSLLRLSQLKAIRGCGTGKREDCYPCLREGDLLDDAIKAASRRAPPRY